MSHELKVPAAASVSGAGLATTQTVSAVQRILALQRTLGNRTTAGLLAAAQPNLTVRAGSAGIVRRTTGTTTTGQSTTGNGTVTTTTEKVRTRERSNALTPEDGLQQFLSSMEDPGKRTLLHNIPSTGMGRFDAEYVPKAGKLLITVRPLFNWNGPWKDTEKESFVNEFTRQTQSRWSGQYRMQCIRPGFEKLFADVEVRVALASKVEDAHFNITVNHAKAGDTFIAREQMKDPTKINTGQFAREDAPERPHDNLTTRCTMALHDFKRIDDFLSLNNVREVHFDESDEIVSGDLGNLKKVVQAVNRTALPGAAPVPVNVVGFDRASERGIFKSNRAQQRANKVAAVLGGMTNHPIRTQTASQQIAAKKKEIADQLKAYERDPNEGFKPEGTRHNEAKKQLATLESERDDVLAKVSADQAWAMSYRGGDNYSILAHEFGHMLGNPDEYFGYGPELLTQKIIELATSKDPVDQQQAKLLAAQKGKLNQNMQDVDRRKVQDDFGKLVSSSGQKIPDMTQKGSTSTASIMNSGAVVLPAHYSTIWEALGRISEKGLPAIRKEDWKFG